MGPFLWLLLAALVTAVAGLSIKLHLMRRAAGEIARGFQEKLRGDTNTLIDISSRDKAMCELASEINAELRRLRRERLRYQQGDLELKAAVTNISHDLRTPLTAICGYLELLQGEELTEKAEEYTGIIKGRTELLRTLTEELFRYCVVLSDPGGLSAEPVDLGAALETSLASFYAVFTEKGITPEIVMPEERVMRRLDKAALSRVFSNLLSNAAKYSDGDLRVELTVEGRLSFANTCRALSGVEVEKLFDRFYTVEAARKSTGLGLSIARALAERMGGELIAEYIDGSLVMTAVFLN
ncbi:MAG: HAMP domain-containing histidine kinase [Acutalibacter sp.]|uniref:sensor histidine kinase n=1 Tax=Acutalibacter sp. TaxID=1918636 RepID=UPI00216F98F5|nr:HAMP domain-containing sensor histidine kinase [Acutalibacter sp.]MCI9225519.1 HAMP domain-containing histidine kinase [Acutalibacter sp.]